MKHLVIFSVEELYDLTYGKPVLCEKNNTAYMSQGCYDEHKYEDAVLMTKQIIGGTVK